MMNVKHRENTQSSKMYKKFFTLRTNTNDLFNNISERIKIIENKLKKSSKKQVNNTRVKQKLSKNIKEEAIEPIKSWSLHGLPNIIRTKYFPLKIIWTILFLTAVGVLIYFLYNTIQDYLKYEVKTVVRSIDVDEMNFPVVTVCNTNKVTTKKGYDYFLFFSK